MLKGTKFYERIQSIGNNRSGSSLFLPAESFSLFLSSANML